MPLFEYHCEICGKVSELLVNSSAEKAQSSYCGSSEIKKLLHLCPVHRQPDCPKPVIPVVVDRNPTRPNAGVREVVVAKTINSARKR
jgi:putative FmdB family regulatory protein